MARRSALQLSIQQPCHQSWDQMTSAPQGRHCASCEQVVVDFRQMTDAELVAWFSARVGQTVCGYYRPDQLGRPVQAAPQPRWQTPFWAIAAVSALAACSSPPSAFEAKPRGEARILPAMVVHGRVSHPKTGKPVEALVGFEGDTTHTFTDSTGQFTLAIPAHSADQQLLFASLMYPHLTASIPTISDEVLMQMNTQERDLNNLPPLGQTRIDTTTPQGGHWPVSLDVLRRWVSPPLPPPQVIIVPYRNLPAY
jgi:hypothetical protein